MEVVVRRIAVVVLVSGPIRQPEFAEQARLDQELEGPVDGRSAHLATSGPQVSDELVGVEMLVRREDVTNQYAARLGELLAPDFQELPKLLFGRIGRPDRIQRGGVRHG